MAIIRGDSETYTITLHNRDGTPRDLTDHTVWITCKSTTAQPDEEALFQHHIEIDENGIVVSQDSLYLGPDGVTAGVLLERIAPGESNAFEQGDYVYDVQVRFPSPDVPGEYDIETPILGDPESVILDITRTTEVTP